MALSVREALSAWDVPCVLFCNEIPMRPGYNFGAAWVYADLYIKAGDAAIARAVLQDTLEIMCAEDRGAETAYPRRINLRGQEWLGIVLCVSWGILIAPIWVSGLALLQSTLLLNDMDHSAMIAMLLVFVIFTCLDLVFLCGLIYLNWARAKRILLAIGPALLGLLALPFWLGYELVRWGWDKLIHPAPLDS
jgi:hypothetical protein